MSPPNPDTVRGMAASARETASATRRGPDSESAAWLTALETDGPDRDAAVSELHALLLRAAHFELARRRSALAQVRGEEIADWPCKPPATL